MMGIEGMHEIEIILGRYPLFWFGEKQDIRVLRGNRLDNWSWEGKSLKGENKRD
jgi:hypothetical protein